MLNVRDRLNAADRERKGADAAGRKWPAGVKEQRVLRKNQANCDSVEPGTHGGHALYCYELMAGRSGHISAW